MNKVKNKVLYRILPILQNYGIPIPPYLRPKPETYTSLIGIGSVVPCQIEAYFLALNLYCKNNDKILDVGFGLGYGLNILAIKCSEVNGVDVDVDALKYCQNFILGRNPKLNYLDTYDGYHLPFESGTFDVITCVDVLEHIIIYNDFLEELLRVSRRGVFISTPNRRPEFTNRDGTPKNYFHLREWSYIELDNILNKHGKVEWNFLNGPFEGPFTLSHEVLRNSIALAPFVKKI